MEWFCNNYPIQFGKSKVFIRNEYGIFGVLAKSDDLHTNVSEFVNHFKSHTILTLFNF